MLSFVCPSFVSLRSYPRLLARLCPLRFRGLQSYGCMATFQTMNTSICFYSRHKRAGEGSVLRLTALFWTLNLAMYDEISAGVFETLSCNV